MMKQSTLDDEQLVRLYQDTSTNILFETLYKRYVGKVYQKCLFITKDSETAQDYTHDIFIKVLTKLDTFQNRSSFSTWLYSVSHHYCLDQIRLNKRFGTETLSDELAGHVPEPDQSESIDFQLNALETVLNRLPEDEISLLRLKHEQGCSIEEIAQQHDLSNSAVKMRLKRTRDKLKLLYSNANY